MPRKDQAGGACPFVTGCEVLVFLQSGVFYLVFIGFLLGFTDVLLGGITSYPFDTETP